MLKITIVGLPNVGKSTLFNRLVKRKSAVVSNVAGVTRDRHEGIGKISNLEFKIIDTGGWNDKTNFSLQVIEQIEFSLSSADVIFFLVDAKVQNKQNKELAKWLKKKTNKPVILIANKCESYKSESVDYLQFFNFIGPIYISAEHNLGMVSIYDALIDVIKSLSNRGTKPFENESIIKLRIAIIGRPNVGKSTFLNSLLKENRLIVNSEPGTTRDSIDISYNHNGKLITLIDTAGIRRKSNIVSNLELRFVKKSMDSIKRSHVIILMLDSLLGIEQQDLSIAEVAIKLGKGIVIVLNKWDLIDRNNRSQLIKLTKQQKISRFFFKVPTVTISALKGIRCDDVIDKCIEVNEFLNKKIGTAKLNKWLMNTIKKHSHPLVKGRAIKIKYITQIGTKPPAFSLICNISRDINENYKRYLIHSLRKDFFIEGVPIRLLFKKNKNPYII